MYHKKHEGEHIVLKGSIHVDTSDDTYILIQITARMEIFQETSLHVTVALHVVVSHHESYKLTPKAVSTCGFSFEANIDLVETIAMHTISICINVHGAHEQEIDRVINKFLI
jgi:hypothetical protein